VDIWIQDKNHDSRKSLPVSVLAVADMCTDKPYAPLLLSLRNTPRHHLKR
jgi:hypothetical protein